MRKRIFRGVFSLDEFVAYLTRSNVNKGVFVFNTQTSTKGGEHWICVAVEDDVIYYFDSFGRNPASYSYVAETLLLSNKIIEWNKYFFQNPATNVCGDYCTLFALLVSCGWHLQQYVNWLYSLGKLRRTRPYHSENYALHVWTFQFRFLQVIPTHFIRYRQYSSQTNR